MSDDRPDDRSAAGAPQAARVPKPDQAGGGLSEVGLDRLFATARSVPSAPSDALFAKVMQDALAVMPQNAPAVVAATVQAPGVFATLTRRWQLFSAGFGGSGVVASLGAVTAVALFLGYSDPERVGEDLMPLVSADSSVDSNADSGVEIVPVAIYFLAGG